MKIHDTKLNGVLLIEPQIFTDNRGTFFESWNQSKYNQRGIPSNFVQDNLSISKKGVLRGLHYQFPRGQGKLISVLEGEIFDVAVDIRPKSPTFKAWIGVKLSSENHHQLWIPEGHAHGFVTMSEKAIVSYKTTDFYCPDGEGTLIWNDPELNIMWPCSFPTLSEKDKKGFSISSIPIEKLPNLSTVPLKG